MQNGGLFLTLKIKEQKNKREIEKKLVILFLHLVLHNLRNNIRNRKQIHYLNNISKNL